MEEIKCPQIEDFAKITPEQVKEYVRFVATLRYNQNRWFRLINFDALRIAQRMEKELDALNGRLLDPRPRICPIMIDAYIARDPSRGCRVIVKRGKYKHWFELGCNAETDAAFERALADGRIRWRPGIEDETQLFRKIY